jgi:glycosyltransferase involved in cell wall biosynthesis
MNVWLVTIGEPLPIDAGGHRLHRAGLLSAFLGQQGHNVVWWTSTFNHFSKTHRFPSDRSVQVNDRFCIRLLSATGYRRNVSLARLYDHAVLATKFRRLASKQTPPDVIVVSLPPLELAAAACGYAVKTGTPVVLDIRDLWPDVFLDVAPAKLRGICSALLAPYDQLAKYACRRAMSIIAPAEYYVEWGLAHAGRPRSDLDREFPLGYSCKAPAPVEIAHAERFWTAHGVKGSDGLIVCFFGTLGRQFDLDPVILAARSLQAMQPRMLFVLCGSGDNEAVYRDRAKDCCNVIFPGWVNAAAIWVLMRKAAVGLAPYRPVPNFLHHIPNKPIEYLSAGLPVLTTLSGRLGHVLTAHDCGMVYEAGNAEELRSMLQSLAADRERRRTLSTNAFALYCEKYVAEAVYSDMIRHLSRIAKAGTDHRDYQD